MFNRFQTGNYFENDHTVVYVYITHEPLPVTTSSHFFNIFWKIMKKCFFDNTCPTFNDILLHVLKGLKDAYYLALQYGNKQGRNSPKHL